MNRDFSISPESQTRSTISASTCVRVRMLTESRGGRKNVSDSKVSDKMRGLLCEHSNCDSCLRWRCTQYFEYEIDEMKKKLGGRRF